MYIILMRLWARVGSNYVEAVAGQSPVLHFRLTGTEDVIVGASGLSVRAGKPLPHCCLSIN